MTSGRAVALAAVAGLAAAAAGAFYPDVFGIYVELLRQEEYGYLALLAPSALAVVTVVAVRHSTLAPPSPARLAAFSVMASLSVLLALSASMEPALQLQLYVLAIASLASGALILLFRPTGAAAGALLALTPFTLVPPPRGLIDRAAAELTGPMADAVAALTGAEKVLYNKVVQLEFTDADGILRRVEIAPACSGVVSVLAVASLAPLVAYLLALGSRAPVRVKALAAAGYAAASMAVVLAGNVLRMALVIWVGSWVGFEEAMEVFHSTPSIIYTSIGAVLGLHVASRLAGAGLPAPTAPPSGDSRLAGLGIAALALAGVLLAASAGALSPQPAPEALVTFKQLVEDTAGVILAPAGVSEYIEVPAPTFQAVLGQAATKMVTVVTNTSRYVGYVEVAESPSRFHSWAACLIAQGYEILDAWSSQTENARIHYMLVERPGARMALVYMVVRVDLAGPGSDSVYVRISLFARGSSQEQIDAGVEELTGIMERVAASVASGQPAGAVPAEAAVLALQASLAGLAAAVAHGTVARALGRLRGLRAPASRGRASRT